MPFDPKLPPHNVQVKAQELRGQFNGLMDLIDAIPAGTSSHSNGLALLGLAVVIHPRRPRCSRS
ncbi:MAG: hypothetical protein NTX35_13270 [Verrucomicrobia bacterium]|nr:hypothetical protein [Verrucomicrobiota bacterium]